MNDRLSSFDHFRFTAFETASLRTEFVPIVQGTDLSRCERVSRIISEFKNVPGIYFWTMRLAGAEFKIYIGKTKSLSLRATNYTAEFQPHSPNDFKLRVFRSFISEIEPSAELDLYFAQTAPDELTPAENGALGKYDPMLNRRMSPSPQSKVALQDAFGVLYRSAFEGLLRHDG